MVFKLDDSCSLEQNSDKLLIRGMEPAEQSKPSETLLPANYHCHCHARFSDADRKPEENISSARTVVSPRFLH